ncbi:thiol reductant ABC exporter subunit CydC [Martelella lutilitoris]|uniref:Thiol reductant ABC exporter subunit CydC n=1 Tax=Martelella lutilitoris TaxID=2583532 RepID=A0A5C4JSA3_9HYPH|nr:thiol reductant ABC exporter subunit CydC [Martelella lutilitoris]TNB48092.1 thiol reductant ABC exporter subunit CydC [Martelella lutilitoris]
MKDFVRLMVLFAPYRKWMLAGIALSVLVVLANVTLLAVSGWFIAAMALTGLGIQTINYFTPAAAIRGLAVLRTVARYLERLVTHEATFRLLSELRVWFYERLEPLAPAGLEAERHGDLLSHLRADIDSLDNLYLRIVAPATAAFIAGILLTGGLAVFSAKIAFITALALVFTGLLTPLLVTWLGQTVGKRTVALRGEMQVQVADTIRGLGELAIAGAVARRRAQIIGFSLVLGRAQRRTAWTTACFEAFSALVGQATVWLAIVAGITAVSAGTLSGPELTMLVFWVMASFEAVSMLPGAFYAYGETAAAARRLFEIADRHPPVAQSLPGDGNMPSSFDIHFSNVTMGYSEAVPAVLKEFSLKLAQGHTIGITGANGAGKTTLLNLLQRFREPDEGTICIGGIPIGEIGDDNLRKLIAVVAQKTHLFNATIRDNLLIASPDADDTALLDAMETAGLADEVRGFSRGLDTMIGELGTRLSGGQARRLAIARALLRDAPILLLDEPTEGLDATSERKVLAAFTRAKADRTTIIVSHRTLALEYCDQVVLLS